MQTLKEQIEKIKLGVNEEEFKEFQNMKVPKSMRLDLPLLEVKVGTNSSLNLNDD